jgi:hypothetical protein
MPLHLVCSVHLIRHPVGGHTWHHLQYLVGLKRLGHRVTFFEDWGWPDSCYDPGRNVMTSDPTCGIDYMRPFFRQHGLDDDWCYLAQDGIAHGLPREQLASRLRGCDAYFNLSGVNYIPEVDAARRKVLVDTDPVFTQVGGHGMHGPGGFAGYDVRFTYGENVGKPGCTMPAAGVTWLPTRQPVVLDLWPVTPGDPTAPITTVINWSAYGDKTHEGKVYGQKDREFEPFFTLPNDVKARAEIAVNGPQGIQERLTSGGWRTLDPREVTRDPFTYQRFIAGSKAEFCVAKHGYVATRSGWFSDRTSAYLASGRPAVVQDTGFSDFLPTGKGLLPFRTPAEARAAVRAIDEDYAGHCAAARAVAESHFDSALVLQDLLDKAL